MPQGRVVQVNTGKLVKYYLTWTEDIIVIDYTMRELNKKKLIIINIYTY